MTTKPVKCYSEKLYLSKEIGICYHLVWRTLLSEIFILQRGPRDGPKMGHRFNEQWVINLSHRVEKFTCLIISSWFWMRSLIRSIGAAAVFEMTAAHPERAKFSAKLNFWAIFSNQSKNKSRYQSSPDRGDSAGLQEPLGPIGSRMDWLVWYQTGTILVRKCPMPKNDRNSIIWNHEKGMNQRFFKGTYDKLTTPNLWFVTIR